jgi:hypothetical protein
MGDIVSLFSDQETDSNFEWNVTPIPGGQSAGTNTITVNTAIDSGNCKLDNGMGANNIPILQENWGGATLQFTGSIYVGWYPVYYQAGITAPSPILGPQAVWNLPFAQLYTIDPHLMFPSNQPPGTNDITINAVSKWVGD